MLVTSVPVRPGALLTVAVAVAVAMVSASQGDASPRKGKSWVSSRPSPKSRTPSVQAGVRRRARPRAGRQLSKRLRVRKLGQAPKRALAKRRARRLAGKDVKRSQRKPNKSAFEPARLLTGEGVSAGARMELLSTAKSEINTSTFIFANDRVGRMKMAQLRDAARSGKKVRLLIDAAGNRLEPRALAALLKAGVEVGIYNPPRLKTLLKPHTYSWRLHDKLVIVDGQQLITGGRNVEDGYYGMKRKGIFQFADTDVHVTGRPAREANEYFLKLWDSRNVKKLDYETYRSKASPRRVREMERALDRAALRLQRPNMKRLRTAFRDHETAKIQSIRFVNDGAVGPRKDRTRTRHTVLAMIKGAKTYVEIQTPYLLPNRKLLRAIRKATKRGVRIRFITNSKQTRDGQKLAFRAYEANLARLAKAGAEVWEYRGSGVLHAKTVVADGNKVFIGSHNIDPRSEKLNREVGVLARSADLAKQVRSSGAFRLRGADLVAHGGDLTPLKKNSCGFACSFLGRRLFGTVLTAVGLYGQL